MMKLWQIEGHNKKPLLWLTLIFIAINLFWGFYSNNTWDDDCPERYFKTLMAFQDPNQFFIPWNRPLFVLIFCLPVQLGAWTIVILQTFFSVVAGWALVQALKKIGIRNAYLAFLFLLFQPFVFGVSRYAMTEPLAITLICLSAWAVTEKRWKTFAILGGLLPLARLELVVLLPLWIVILQQNKNLKHFFYLGIPLTLWWLASGLYNSNMLWLFEQTLSNEGKENRYGHQDWFTYLERFQYVTGPIVFLFFILGVSTFQLKKLFKFFFLPGLLIGFITYTLFSSVLNMGNAAGFLRNLLPLSPFVAAFAVLGLNRVLAYRKIDFDLQTYPKKKLKAAEEKIERIKKKRGIVQKSLLITITFVAVTTVVFFSYNLKSHHLIDKNHLTYVFILCQLPFLLLISIHLFNPLTAIRPFLVATTIAVTLGFTLITEHPNANNNSERETIKKVAEFYKKAQFDKTITYANHPWFYWSADLLKSSDQTKSVTQENLNNAAAGSIVIAENHYCQRLSGDLTLNYFGKHKEWIEISSFNNPENDFFISIYQKVNNQKDGIAVLNDYIEKTEQKDASSLLLRGLYFLNEMKDQQKAIVEINKAAKIDPSLIKIHLTLGKIALRNNDLSSALIHFSNVLKLDNQQLEANERVGNLLFQKGEYQSAALKFKKITEVTQPKKANQKPPRIYISAKRNLGKCYFSLRDYKNAYEQFNHIIILKEDKAEDHFNIGNIALIGKQTPIACKAFTKALEMGMKEAQGILDQHCK